VYTDSTILLFDLNETDSKPLLQCINVMCVQEDYGSFYILSQHEPGTFTVPEFCSSATVPVMSRRLRGSRGASPVEVDAADPMGCFV
jgi:hypothetical protein